MQRAARVINDPIPAERRLELRIGVNLGDVIVDGDDIFGDGVNIAARLEALAEPGTVCISQTVYDQVRNKLDLDYRPLGSHRVKNIAEPIRAYAVGVSVLSRTVGEEPPPPRDGCRRRGDSFVAGLASVGASTQVPAETARVSASAPSRSKSLASPRRRVLAGRPSVAVLPFENLSGDAGQDFFSDGITEDVITALGRFSNLLVVAKSASFQFKGQNLAPAEIGRRLDVLYLLDGSVRRAGDRVRVNAELDRGRDGAKHLVRSVRRRGQGHLRCAGGHCPTRRRRGCGEAHPFRAGPRPRQADREPCRLRICPARPRVLLARDA